MKTDSGKPDFFDRIDSKLSSRLILRSDKGPKERSILVYIGFGIFAAALFFAVTVFTPLACIGQALL